MSRGSSPASSGPFAARDVGPEGRVGYRRPTVADGVVTAFGVRGSTVAK